MERLNVEDAQRRLANLIEQALDGEDVVIVRDDGLGVRLMPIHLTGHPRFGSARGWFTMADDFDAPLPDLVPYER